MGYAVDWTDLPKDLVIDVSHRSPLLLLAEEVAEGAIRYNCEYDREYSDTDDDDGGDGDDDDDDGDGDDDDGYDPLDDMLDKLLELKARNSISSSRGLYSLSSMKTYDIELPEAAGRLILGTKGWLVTLGRDLQINLLHPLLRHQFSLPPMHTFPKHEYHEIFTPEYNSEDFLHKVAMSSKLINKITDTSFSHHHATPSPVVMAIYETLGYLGFARLGDKVWTDVDDVPCKNFHDIVYHKGNFFAVDTHGHVFICSIDDDKDRGPRGTKIAFLDTDHGHQKYLVESLSGSHLLLLVRHIETKYFKEPPNIEAKYRTTNFSVWRLNLNYYDSLGIPSCTLTKKKNLGDESIFVGRSSSVSVSSSEIIKPNSIYFTDDSRFFIRRGGGHDMGIFDMKRRTIEPHFQGKSIHPVSPPLWCF